MAENNTPGEGDKTSWQRQASEWLRAKKREAEAWGGPTRYPTISQLIDELDPDPTDEHPRFGQVTITRDPDSFDPSKPWRDQRDPTLEADKTSYGPEQVVSFNVNGSIERLRLNQISEPESLAELTDEQVEAMLDDVMQDMIGNTIDAGWSFVDG